MNRLYKIPSNLRNSNEILNLKNHSKFGLIGELRYRLIVEIINDYSESNGNEITMPISEWLKEINLQKRSLLDLITELSMLGLICYKIERFDDNEDKLTIILLKNFALI